MHEVSSDVIIHKFTNCSKTPESKVCHLEQQTTEHTYIPDKDNATGKSARGKARATFTWQFLANWAVYAIQKEFTSIHYRDDIIPFSTGWQGSGTS